MTEIAFLDVIQKQVELFSELMLLKRLDAGTFSLSDYQRILLRLFHQVCESANTFSLAATFVEPARFEVKSYLMRHAEEEKLHWQWILSDLRNTGYSGVDPLISLPYPEVAAYIGYNYYVALKCPIGRLAIAAMLESIGANFGARYSAKLITVLGLNKDQVVFFQGHGDTDVGHTREIVDVLQNAQLSSEEWNTMAGIAETAGALYRLMYESGPW